MNWNFASHITLVIFKLARQTLSMLYRITLWHYLRCAQENGGKSPIVQFDTTTTQSQGKTLDSNDLNQVVASSGFSENKGLGRVLSLAGS